MKAQPKLDKGTWLVWQIASTIGDFVLAAFLMLGMGSLGISWGYWHAWWVGFCFASALNFATFGFTKYLDYIARRMS